VHRGLNKMSLWCDTTEVRKLMRNRGYVIAIFSTLLITACSKFDSTPSDTDAKNVFLNRCLIEWLKYKDVSIVSFRKIETTRPKPNLYVVEFEASFTFSQPGAVDPGVKPGQLKTQRGKIIFQKTENEWRPLAGAEACNF